MTVFTETYTENRIWTFLKSRNLDLQLKDPEYLLKKDKIKYNCLKRVCEHR